MPTSDQWTYSQLLAAMQTWPVNAGTTYVATIPRFIRMAEQQVITDLNLDIFDAVDYTETITVGNKLIAKPAGLVQLRSMRLALVTGTISASADPQSICLTQDTAVNSTAMNVNGTDQPAPITFNPARQVSVTSVNAPSGVSVVVQGLDQNGNPITETLVTVMSTLVLGTLRFSKIIGVTSFNGAPGETVKVGNAAVTANTLGASWPVNRRSKAFCDAFNNDPAVVGRPTYFNELNSSQWEVVSAADQTYGVMLHFVMLPQSIVDAGTTWLGDNCGELLFYMGLMKAERFLKADDRFSDIQGDYEQQMQMRRTELRESIRTGEYSPMKPAATKAQ